MRELLRRLEMSREQVLHLEAALDQLQREKEQLAATLQAVESRFARLESECAECKHRLEASQSEGNSFSAHEKAEIQAKIEQYLKEIDLCLKFFGD